MEIAAVIKVGIGGTAISALCTHAGCIIGKCPGCAIIIPRFLEFDKGMSQESADCINLYTNIMQFRQSAVI